MAESETKLAQGNGIKRDTRQRLGQEYDSSMYRADGSKKSARGFLGPIKNLGSGRTMTEFSTDLGDDFEFEGRTYPANMSIPTMVPTQRSEAIEYMQNMKEGMGLNRSIPMEAEIGDVAISHAHMRITKGLNPFYQDGEDE